MSATSTRSTSTRARITITRRSVLVAVTVVAVCIAWALAFYLPQTHKLTALDAQRSSLDATLATDQARLQQLQSEAHHVTEIRAMVNRLNGYVPTTEKLYTYVHTISQSAKSAGVTITSLAPSNLVAITGTRYSAIPITASVKGTYDQLLAFLKGLYELPRLTDVNALSVTGGGPGTNRATVLSASFQLAVFTSQKPVSGAAP
jgi:Tfp pilus assembly protein PilO